MQGQLLLCPGLSIGQILQRSPGQATVHIAVNMLRLVQVRHDNLDTRGVFVSRVKAAGGSIRVCKWYP